MSQFLYGIGSAILGAFLGYWIARLRTKFLEEEVSLKEVAMSSIKSDEANKAMQLKREIKALEGAKSQLTNELDHKLKLLDVKDNELLEIKEKYSALESELQSLKESNSSHQTDNAASENPSIATKSGWEEKYKSLNTAYLSLKNETEEFDLTVCELNDTKAELVTQKTKVAELHERLESLTTEAADKADVPPTEEETIVEGPILIAKKKKSSKGSKGKKRNSCPKDDLTVIYGIGNKTQQHLFANGISSYEQIIALNEDCLRNLVLLIKSKKELRNFKNWKKEAKQALKELLKQNKKGS